MPKFTILEYGLILSKFLIDEERYRYERIQSNRNKKESSRNDYERNGCTRLGSSQYDLLECVEDFSADNIFQR